MLSNRFAALSAGGAGGADVEARGDAWGADPWVDKGRHPMCKGILWTTICSSAVASYLLVRRGVLASEIGSEVIACPSSTLSA
jgi:hypothetical protein